MALQQQMIETRAEGRDEQEKGEKKVWGKFVEE